MRVLTGGLVRTMNDGGDVAEAVAFDGDRIVAVGRAADVLRAAGPGAEVRDLGGRAVVPGFVDPHHHLLLGALYAGTVDCRPEVAPSIDAIVERLRSARASSPPEGWIVGVGYDAFRLRERRHPSRHDLDRACDDRPVLLVHFSFHECVAGTRALEAAGIGRTTPDPPAGRIERDRRGDPTGRLVETAMASVERMARASVERDGAGLIDRLAAHERAALAVGITRVGDAAVSPDVAALYARARAEGKLRLPVDLMPVSDRGYLLQPWDALDGTPTGGGEPGLRIGPLKIIMDGAEACALRMSPGQAVGALGRAAWHAAAERSLGPLRAVGRARARIGRDGAVRHGLIFWDAAGAADLVRRAVDRGFSVAIHAVGNEAVARAVGAIGASRAGHRASPPPRVEHAVFVDRDTIRRMADAGVTVVTQPAFLSFVGRGQAPDIPGIGVLPLRTMREAGVRVAGSSDGPCAPIDPLEAIRAAVGRRTASGEVVQPDEAIAPIDALAMHTREAARAAGCDGEAGTIEAGKRADLVVLTADVGAAKPGDLGGVRVVETILAGRTEYSAP